MFLNIGIISILDDECLRPGDATDHSFLEKLSQKLDGHKHYKSHRRSDIKTQKIMGRDVSTPDLEIIRNFLFSFNFYTVFRRLYFGLHNVSESSFLKLISKATLLRVYHIYYEVTQQTEGVSADGSHAILSILYLVCYV